jgi:hypothetical protein
MWVLALHAATASAIGVDRPVDLSAGSLLAPPCLLGPATAPDFLVESEPVVAVDPRDAHHVVAVWMQGLPPVTLQVSAVSRDGGRTWKDHVVTGQSYCSHGTGTWAPDPWLAIGPEGTVYDAVTPDTSATDPLTPSERVSVSRDGGATWLAPVELGSPADRGSIAADRAQAGRAYIAYSDGTAGGYHERVVVARTDDAGGSWSKPAVAAPATGEVLNSPMPAVTTGGSIVVAYTAQLDDEQEARAVRSDDGGRTWSAPVTLGRASYAPADPDLNGFTAGAIGEPAVAANRHGDVYIAWPHDNTILVAASHDAGRSWSPPRTIRSGPGAAIVPGLALGYGHLGAIWTDYRNDRPGDAQLTADVWFATSGDGGKTWHESHLAGPFDYRRGEPLGNPGFVVTDINGIAAVPDGFLATFAATAPVATEGTQDVFTAHIRVP